MHRGVSATLALLVPTAPALAQCELGELEPGQAESIYGVDAEIDGDVTVVGSWSALNVFERRPEGWTHAARLESPLPGEEVAFASRVAVSGNRVVGSDPLWGWYEYGKTYVVERRDGGWQVRDTLSHLPAEYDQAGFDVDIDGDWVVVGARKAGPSWTLPEGRVFLFQRVGDDWVAAQHLTASDVQTGFGFGTGVDLDGARLLVGLGEDSPVRRAYVYELEGGVWSEKAVLELPDDHPGELCRDVALAGDRALIGTRGAGDERGSGWLFERQGGSWTLASRFSAAEAPSGDESVWAVALSHTDAVLGALGHAWIFGVEGGRSASECVGAPNSAGAGCTLALEGSTSIGANALELRATGAVAGQFGLFFYGEQATQLPFGDGYLCIAGTAWRLEPPVPIGPDGGAARAVDLTAPPAGAGSGAIEPGDARRFQFWYRDPAAGGAGFNLSDALYVEFCP